MSGTRGASGRVRQGGGCRVGWGVAWVGGSPADRRHPLAWVRCGGEFYLPLSVSLLCFLFFLSQLCHLACTWNSVCIYPSCINALVSHDTPSRLNLHNNALGSRESTSRLGLYNNALGLRETPSRLGLHNIALGLRETPSRLGLHECPLLGVNKCFLVCLCLLS